MKSMIRQLLLQLLIALLIGSVVVGIFSYLSVRDEISEIFDEHLKQMALVLEKQKATETPDPSPRERLKGEEEFLIQAYRGDLTLLYSTHPKIMLPPPDKGGYDTRNFQKDEWRSYSSQSGDVIIQVSQPLSVRSGLILEITLKMLLPILLQFPILGVLIWLAVRHSLDSLSLISKSLQARSLTSLEPVEIDDVPKEIRPLVDGLNDLLERLSDSMKLQRRFTADAAHELRTPLTAVQLQLELLKRTKKDEEREETINILAEGIKRSTRLVEKLLAFARLEAEAGTHNLYVVDILSLCREVVQFFLSHAIQKNIDLGMVRQESVFIQSTSDGMRAVLGNLIENALNYTPEDGRVDVSVYAEDHQVVIEIADNGSGIPIEERERIFDRFYRIAGTKVQGTGIGLAIVQNILQAHGASILVTDGIEGKGSCFKVIFPQVDA